MAARLLSPLARGGRGGRAARACGTPRAPRPLSWRHLRTKFVHPLLRLACNVVPNTVQVFINIIIEDPQYADSKRLNHSISALVPLTPPGSIMRFAVQLDGEVDF